MATKSISQSAEPMVTVNRNQPLVLPPSSDPTFSVTPTDFEITRAHIFAEPLEPMGKTTAQDNLQLSQALLLFLQRTNSDDFGAVSQFLDTHPQSAWRESLLTDLGLAYRKTGWFSKALACWEEAWQLGKNETDANAKAVADRALGELLELNARLGRYDRLEALFAETKGRILNGAVSEKITGAHEGLWLMENQPDKAFRCGPMALNQILAFEKPGNPTDRLIINSRSTLEGMSLSHVCDLANQLGMNLQMAKRQPGSPVILPAVIHWKVGHYASILKQVNGRYLIQDPTFGDELWISPAALDAEASGYFLVRAGDLPQGWSPVSASDGQTVWGKGNTDSNDPNHTKKIDWKCDCNGNPIPMAQYNFHTMLVSLNIMDTPVGYAPPLGPDVHFEITYNQREANQPTIFSYSNFGQKWTFNWLSYISDNPSQLGGNVSYYVQGGGTEIYPGSSYTSTNNTYAADPETDATLQIVSATNYLRVMPDGSEQIFSVPNAPTNATSRQVFLKQMVDPYGNTLTLNYDSYFRITSLVDSIGQVTTLSYASNNISSPLFYQIAKVTDPFGRFATFSYNTNGQLATITDILGINSQFTYGLSDDGTVDFINSMTTPYGTTTFTEGESGRNRWLTATDPVGGQERLEYDDSIATQYITDYGQAAPTNIVTGGTATTYLYNRNSFFWDKRAMLLNPGDYTKAQITHWLHTADLNVCSGTIESTKNALEGRVWYTYPGQTPSTTYQEGTNDSPSAVARVLDDGTTQITQYQYNSFGKPLQTIDPAGRTTFSTYATNNIDLLTVAQLAAGATNYLNKFTYNAQHLRLTAVDAAGQTNFYGYNTNGQLIATTNALKEITLMNYNANGYLTNVITGTTTSLLSTNSFTYDGYGRVRTVTDPLGYTVTTSYDAADRMTNTTYMDGTYQQVVYNLLDPVLKCDRDGHWTAMIYDPLRHLTDTFDNLGRHTQFSWCSCGSMVSMTDPLGRVTSWIRDLQSRVQTKIFPDLMQINYIYATNTSRLMAMTDAQGQTTSYSYFIDDNPAQVSYSNVIVATPTVSYTYDTNYNRMITMTDGTGVTTYNYYPVISGQFGAGQLSSVSNSFIGATSLITYNYDALGRMTNRAINGVSQQITFDALHRVTLVTNALGSFTNTYIGGTTLLSTNFYPNGQKTTFSYLSSTNDERLAQILNQNNGGVTLSQFNYSYDPVGNITNWTQQADTNATTAYNYGYDAGNQIISAVLNSTGAGATVLKQYAYGYDLAGNRTGEQIGTGTNGAVAISQSSYNADNQVTNRTGGSGSLLFAGSLNEQARVSVGGNSATVNHATTNFMSYASVISGTNVVPVIATDYSNNSRTNKYQLVVTNNGVAKTISYDLNGNETNVAMATSTNSYQFDAANRLVVVTSPTNQSLFAYDGLGRRVQIIEKTNGVAYITNKFIWDGQTLVEKRSGTATNRFFAEGEQISGINYFFTHDHLGSVREVMSNAGVLQARYDYDPYGRRTVIAGSFTADFGYAGMYYHPASGLNLTLYRAYDSDFGRWPNRDPIGERGGINLYGYVANNPINRIDRFGLQLFDPDMDYSWDRDADPNSSTASKIGTGLLNLGDNIGAFEPNDPENPDGDYNWQNDTPAQLDWDKKYGPLNPLWPPNDGQSYLIPARPKNPPAATCPVYGNTHSRRAVIGYR